MKTAPVRLNALIGSNHFVIWLLVSCLLVPGETKADPIGNAPVVEVFTDRAHPLTNTEALPGAIIYRIDRLVAVQERLSEGLPADEAAAIRIARERAAGIDRDALTQSAQGLALAHLKYRLDRYPAIVFGGQAVIYGVTDLALAKRLHDEARESAQEGRP